MSQLATFISFKTHDYVAENGILQQRLAVLTEAYTRSVTPLGSYQFDTTFGSEIPLLINNRTVLITSKILTTMQNACLKPMIDSGRVLAITTSVTTITNNKAFINCDILDNNQNTYSLPLSFITR